MKMLSRFITLKKIAFTIRPVPEGPFSKTLIMRNHQPQGLPAEDNKSLAAQSGRLQEASGSCPGNADFKMFMANDLPASASHMPHVISSWICKTAAIAATDCGLEDSDSSDSSEIPRRWASWRMNGSILYRSSLDKQLRLDSGVIPAQFFNASFTALRTHLPTSSPCFECFPAFSRCNAEDLSQRTAIWSVPEPVAMPVEYLLEAISSCKAHVLASVAVTIHLAKA